MNPKQFEEQYTVAATKFVETYRRVWKERSTALDMIGKGDERGYALLKSASKAAQNIEKLLVEKLDEGAHTIAEMRRLVGNDKQALETLAIYDLALKEIMYTVKADYLVIDAERAVIDNQTPESWERLKNAYSYSGIQREFQAFKNLREIDEINRRRYQPYRNYGEILTEEKKFNGQMASTVAGAMLSVMPTMSAIQRLGISDPATGLLTLAAGPVIGALLGFRAYTFFLEKEFMDNRKERQQLIERAIEVTDYFSRKTLQKS